MIHQDQVMYLLKILLIFIFTSVGYRLQADRLMLLDSTLFIGEVSKVSNCEIKFNSDGVDLKFDANEVAFIEFTDFEDYHFRNYVRKVSEDSGYCFSYLKFMTAESDNKVSVLVGPNYSLTGGEGESIVDYVTANVDDADALATYYEMRKARRKKNIRTTLLIMSILNLF